MHPGVLIRPRRVRQSPSQLSSRHTSALKAERAQSLVGNTHLLEPTCPARARHEKGRQCAKCYGQAASCLALNVGSWRAPQFAPGFGTASRGPLGCSGRASKLVFAFPLPSLSTAFSLECQCRNSKLQSLKEFNLKDSPYTMHFPLLSKAQLMC